ncbi:MAG: hypothetical protein CMJ47_02775 [Planctomyces sp.]|nr:hypothetical protein [Planctomyces sp.]
MELLIHANGDVRCIYGEVFPLHHIGCLSIQRASHVEPTIDGRWVADLSPVNGPTIGPFRTRTAALEAEANWLRKNWLIPD